MKNIEITFNDGTKKAFPEGTSYYEISKKFKLKHKIIGVIANSRVTSLYDCPSNDMKVEFLDLSSNDGNRIYIAGLRMIFEYAVKKTFPDIDVKYSYSLPHGLVAELVTPKVLLNDDISLIREKMAEVIFKDMPIKKISKKSIDGIKYYQEKGNIIKANNIQNIVDPSIVLYELDDLVNYYYYEMPYSTSVIDTYEIRYIGKNLVVINFPNSFHDGKLPDYENYKGVIESYAKGNAWLQTMKVPYIQDVNNKICEGKISNFIRSSELNFNLDINKIVQDILSNDKIKCIMISGPSSSGKTTVTHRIANYLSIYGYDPVVISIDDYFKERVNNPKDENGEYDFECLEATDIDYLTKDVIKLFNGEEIMLPNFNFITGCKEVSGKKAKLKDNSIVLFEGLHAIDDRLLPIIPKEIKYKVYISPYIPLSIDEQNYISSNDLRLIRRIVRDFRTRGYGVDATINYWQKVRLGEEKYILPCIHEADTIINTSLPYEVGVLKVFVEPLLYSVPTTSACYNEARRLLSFLKQFFSINSEFIPKDSILREFIGGNND